MLLEGRPFIGLAPMAGVTDRAFRQLAKKHGADLVVSEMVSAKGICYDNERTTDLLAFAECERPVSLQIFGSEPETMAKAAQVVAGLGPDLIDINMGCPTPKIVKNGDGSALMRDPVLAGEVVRAVVEASTVPVSVKIRLGWDDEHINAVEVALKVQEAGAALLTVHGRTREQFYRGRAAYRQIARVKAAVTIPVLGNGDVDTPETALLMLEQTRCDGILIGRAAMGNPWIFRRSKHYLLTGELLPEPSSGDKVNMIRTHAQLAVRHKGEKTAMKEMRKHIGWYLKGEPYVVRLKQKLNSITTWNELEDVLQEFCAAQPN